MPARRPAREALTPGPRSYAMSVDALEKLEKLRGLLGESKKNILELAIVHLYEDWLRGRVTGIERQLVVTDAAAAE